MSDYHKQRDENNIYRLRTLLKQLPAFCKEFFVGIQNTTSVLTRLNYAYDLRIFFDYLVKEKIINKKTILNITLFDLEAITAYDIELYLDYLTSYFFNGKKYTCGEHGKHRKLSSLRSFLNYYFNKDKLTSNVALKVSMPKILEKPIIKLEPNEVARLLDEIECEDIVGLSKHQNAYLKNTKIRDLAIISLFLGTGIRISELVGLNLEDIDFSSYSFTITRKGGNKSILYFSDEVAKPLYKYLDFLQNEIDRVTKFGQKIKDSPALFFSLQGNRISVRAVQDLVKKYAKLISPLKNITPHKLRSTFGTELYKNTQDIYIVADVLGHKDINTTKKHYASISDEIRRAAAKTVILRDNKD